MGYLSKETLLQASDLTERDVELPTLGADAKVKVRSLSAAFSNQAQSEALEMKQVGRDQISTVNVAKMEVIQAYHGLVEPHLESLEEAEKFAQRCGPAFKSVIAAIDEISGVDKAAIEEADARFPSGRGREDRTDVEAPDPGGEGDRGPAVPARAGARAGKVGAGAN